MESVKENCIKRLYNWTISWAETPYSMIALILLSFAESPFFPIPPDVLLIPMVFALPRKWWWIAFVCTISSVVGGVLGWGIGYFGWSVMKDFFFEYIPGFTSELFDVVSSQYKENAFLAIFGAALTPIPYKIFTIAAGVCNVPIATLVLGSILGRGGRFFAVALIIYFVGDKAKPFIEKYFNIIVSVFFVLLVLGFMCVKYVI
ncbi:MAG: DedA family protein [Opitutales bacterium]|nr:DedA family protein [Opitutales bacterium]